ncbi:flippase-like domain-containing protein [bacterium]|nr:flippase-like domain-containing protein [bacterium]
MTTISFNILKKLLNILKYLVFLSLGFGIFFYVYPVKEITDLLHKLKEANYIYIFPVIAIALSSHYSRALRWKMLIDPLGYKVKPFSSFRAIMIGYYFNTLVPRMGEVSRCVALNRIDRVPVSAVLGTVITERIFDLISLAFVVGLTVLLEFDLVGEYIIDLVVKKIAGLGGLFSFNMFLLLLVAAILGLLGFWILKKTGIYDKISGLLVEFKEGLISVRKLKNPLAFIGHTAYIWISYYTMCYLSFFTLPETAGLGPSAGLVVFTLSTIGFIAPVPGGVGTYQFMFTLALGFFFVDELAAKSVAMIAFMVNTVLNLIIGAIALFMSPKKDADAPLVES